MSMMVNPYRFATSGITSDIAFLSGFEGADGSTSMVDESLYNHTLVASGSAQIDTAQAKFGSSSLYLPDSSLVTVNDSGPRTLGTSWTIEFFIRLYAWGPFDTFLDKLVTTGNQRSLRITSSGGGTLRVVRSADGAATQNIDRTFGTGGLNTWEHWCFEHDGAANEFRIYKNGTVQGAVVSGAYSYFANTTTPWRIGNSPDNGSNGTTGWIDELRIDTVNARYKGNFTVPTAAYPR